MRILPDHTSHLPPQPRHLFLHHHHHHQYTPLTPFSTITSTNPALRYTKFTSVGTDTTIGKVSQILDRRHFVLVTSEQRCYTGADKVQTKVTIFSIVTRIDILNFIMNGGRKGSGASSPTNRSRAVSES